MRIQRFLLLMAIAGAVLSTTSCNNKCTSAQLSPVDYVNPLTGTASTYELSTGNTSLGNEFLDTSNRT